MIIIALYGEKEKKKSKLRWHKYSFKKMKK